MLQAAASDLPELNGLVKAPVPSPLAPQQRAFQRLWQQWPPRLLIADEVGLGKTVQAGLLLRQAWLSGRARRMLVMAPASVLKQWQRELREKFGLDWPIYSGKTLDWQPTRFRPAGLSRPVDRSSWTTESYVLVSSHLMRRRDRHKDLLEAEPYDLVCSMRPTTPAPVGRTAAAVASASAPTPRCAHAAAAPAHQRSAALPPRPCR